MKNNDMPSGKKEVRHALIQAAASCFAEKGIQKVSVREIASRAKVNHGLVHRHFGSKQELTQEVFQMLSQQVDVRLQSVPEEVSLQALLPHIFGETQEGGLHWKILTHALVEGIPMDWIQTNFPVFERLQKACVQHLNRLEINHPILPEKVEQSATIQSILIFATGLGFLAFKPFLQAACESQEQNWNHIRPQLMQAFLAYVYQIKILD